MLQSKCFSEEDPKTLEIIDDCSSVVILEVGGKDWLEYSSKPMPFVKRSVVENYNFGRTQKTFVGAFLILKQKRPYEGNFVEILIYASDVKLEKRLTEFVIFGRMLHMVMSRYKRHDIVLFADQEIFHTLESLQFSKIDDWRKDSRFKYLKSLSYIDENDREVDCPLYGWEYKFQRIKMLKLLERAKFETDDEYDTRLAKGLKLLSLETTVYPRLTSASVVCFSKNLLPRGWSANVERICRNAFMGGESYTQEDLENMVNDSDFVIFLLVKRSEILVEEMKTKDHIETLPTGTEQAIGFMIIRELSPQYLYLELFAIDRRIRKQVGFRGAGTQMIEYLKSIPEMSESMTGGDPVVRSRNIILFSVLDRETIRFYEYMKFKELKNWKNEIPKEVLAGIHIPRDSMSNEELPLYIFKSREIDQCNAINWIDNLFVYGRNYYKTEYANWFYQLTQFELY